MDKKCLNILIGVLYVTCSSLLLFFYSNQNLLSPFKCLLLKPSCQFCWYRLGVAITQLLYAWCSNSFWKKMFVPWKSCCVKTFFTLCCTSSRIVQLSVKLSTRINMKAENNFSDFFVMFKGNNYISTILVISTDFQSR